MSHTCRSCGVPIIWTITEKGRPMPVNAEPSDYGNVILQERPMLPPRARYLNAREKQAILENVLPPPKLYLSHFVRCVDAASWRRRNAE